MPRSEASHPSRQLAAASCARAPRGPPPLRPRHARIPTLIDTHPAATKGTDARHGKIRARRIAAPHRA
ncbi:hypothetical protein BVI2075_120077 [Burkholderia vietnamiensis]|nr:hypothetical protein BVI2075_120077 [Burkholderia vietnamiensis]